MTLIGYWTIVAFQAISRQYFFLPTTRNEFSLFDYNLNNNRKSYFFAAIAVQKAHFQSSSKFCTRWFIGKLFTFFWIWYWHFENFSFSMASNLIILFGWWISGVNNAKNTLHTMQLSKCQQWSKLFFLHISHRRTHT